MQDLFSYSLNDFLLFSSETYVALVRDFVAHYYLFLLIPLFTGLILSFMYRDGQQIKRQLFFFTLLAVNIPITLFYLYHYSQIQTFYQWFIFATGLQEFLILFMAFRFMQVKGMALFTIRDLLPNRRAFVLIILSTVLIQVALLTEFWQTSWHVAVFLPATYWWMATMLFLYSASQIKVWLLPVSLLMMVTEVTTLYLLELPYIWLYLLLPFLIFIASRSSGSQQL